MVECIELLERRFMLAAVPRVQGWWGGVFENTAGDEGEIHIRFKQRGKVLTGEAIDDDGGRWKVRGKISKIGVIWGTLDGDSEDGDGKFRGKLKRGRITGTFSGEANVGPVFGRFSVVRI